nr:uncharacterized protein LOC127346082 [Lolium perenne]
MRPPALATRSTRCSCRQWPGHTINSRINLAPSISRRCCTLSATVVLASWRQHLHLISELDGTKLFSLLTIIQSIALRHFIPESEVEVLCLQSSQERSTMSTATAC